MFFFHWEEEVKFQSYILSFMFFSHWKEIYENADKGLHRSTENQWNVFIKVVVFIIFNIE